MIGVADRNENPDWKKQQLAEIGIDEETLLQALGFGVAGRARCTANHPKMAPGMYMYLETVNGLGDLTANAGWTRKDDRGFATIERADGLVAIAVASGNDGTGDLFADVTTRSPKGVATEEAVSLNLSLPLDDRYVADNERIVNRQPGSNKKAITWFLLHDIRDGVLYSELSRPMSISEGYVAEWAPRIVLATQHIDPARIEAPTEPPVDPAVDVKRRDPR